MKECYAKVEEILDNFRSISLLAVRLILAYGFFEPALKKFANIESVASWFGSLGIPFPTFNAYLAATTELFGVVLLGLGFLTRLISIPLMVVMLVAIFLVHLPHGFSAASNGFEIPFYYLLFLIVLATHGAGKISADYFVFSKKE
jgi:putative oxidoreductase